MQYRDISKLKPGARLKIKRGYRDAGKFAEFLGFPIRYDYLRVKVRFNGQDYVWPSDKVTLVKSECVD